MKVGSEFGTYEALVAAGAHCAQKHGAIGVGVGVVTVHLASGPYPNVDHGNVVDFWGSFLGDAQRNQVPRHGNLALINAAKSKDKVRLSRSSSLKSDFAPLEGERYDGLYYVESYTYVPLGPEGRMAYKFRLVLCEDQPMPPRRSLAKKRPAPAASAAPSPSAKKAKPSFAMPKRGQITSFFKPV